MNVLILRSAYSSTGSASEQFRRIFKDVGKYTEMNLKFVRTARVECGILLASDNVQKRTL